MLLATNCNPSKIRSAVPSIVEDRLQETIILTLSSTYRLNFSGYDDVSDIPKAEAEKRAADFILPIPLIRT